MSETSRIIDLDQVITIPVMLGAREFTVTQQRRALIERVLCESNRDLQTTQAPESEDGRTLIETMFANFDDSLPVIALIFGCETLGKERDELIAFLKEHLNPDGAIRIFETWWEINRIEDFFLRGGKAVMPPYIVRILENPDVEISL